MRNFLKITLVAVSLLTFNNIAHANGVLMSTVYSNGNYETHSQNPLGNTTGNHDCRTIHNKPV